MLNKLKPTIAIIDSGIGGISILRQLIERYHCGNYVYFADNLYMPYGRLKKNFLRKRLETIINTLRENYQVNKIIIACNTASAVLKGYISKDVITMNFIDGYTYIATPLTKKMLPNLPVISNGTLAKRIEENIFNTKLDKIIFKFIKRYKLDNLDSFVLGCTHYELVEDIFKKYCPNTKIYLNSQFAIKDLNYEPNDENLSILFLQSNESKSYLDKLNKLIGR